MPSPLFATGQRSWRRLKPWVGGAALLLALGGTAYIALAPLGDAHRLLAAAGTDNPAYNRPYRVMPTTAFANVTTGRGDILIDLRDVADEDLVKLSSLYYRMCYAAYPGRVHVSLDGARINTADDFRRQESLPDDAELRRLGIGLVVRIGKSRDGIAVVSLRDVR